MGRRDFRWREAKKPKKKAKKPQVISELLPPVEVEVIKKGKKEREEE
jgi:hypothetical protein